ncbi:MAG: hypothetical protein BHW62_05770 [Acinetobacter sp. CAG:196_36_41]|nr:MAG: hypothetical protein BHW62_05770 [Acinetobacter sp. CAG:196_36_41]
MYRLDNHAIALYLYLLEDKKLSIETTPSCNLADDLHEYFDILRALLDINEPGVVSIEPYDNCCDVTLNSNRKDELREHLTKYVELLTKDELVSKDNVLSWKNELKTFINNAKNSGYNLKSYNVTVEDMQVVLYGLMQNLFMLKRIDIIPDEMVYYFFSRNTSREAENVCVEGFYKQLKVSCTVDIESYINKQNKKNVNTSSAFTTQEDWLYRYICETTGHVSTSIPMQIDLVDVDQTKPSTFPNFEALKQACYRLNKRYEKKYGLKPFIKKVKNEDLFHITFAPNDKGKNLL